MKRMTRLLALLLALLLPAGSLAEALPSAPSGVTYEIFVASFQDSDGDGRGDLQGVINRLDYLESLGVSQIWLMPIHPSPSYHKYDVLDYYDVDPSYGTLADFDALTEACHARGIKVLIDLVVNHSSDSHPWFKAASDDKFFKRTGATTDWYNFYEEAGNARHKISGCNWYYEGQFGSHMPDFNLDSASFRAEVAKIITFWQEHGVDGFRLDTTTNYYTGANGKCAEFIRFICETARANDPDTYVVGEAWVHDIAILELYESGINSLFNFPGSDVQGRFVKAALNAKAAGAVQAQAEWNAKIKAISPESVDAPFLSNHDQARARGMLRSKVPNEKAAALLYLMMPGIPTVYYGEELGMSGSGRDENKRLPMVWSADETTWCKAPADADQAQRLKEGVAEQDADPDSLLNCYRTLINLRKLAPELVNGKMTALDGGSDAVGFFRVEDEGSAVAVIVNIGQKEACTVDLSVLGPCTLLGTYGAVEVAEGTATMQPLSCALLRLNAE